MAGKQKRGPKTERGKAAVRLNPLKHGVLSQTPVIPLVEREEDWVRLRDGIFEYFGVEGMMEESLADQIAVAIWRRYRLVRYETEVISAYLESVPEDYRRMVEAEGMASTGSAGSSPVLRQAQDEREEGQDRAQTGEGPGPRDIERMDRMLSARLMPGAETADKIMRYETKLHRFMLQTIHELLVLQALRKGTSGRPSPAIWSGGDDKRITRGPRPRKLRRLEGFARAVTLGHPSTEGRQDELDGVDADVVVEAVDGAQGPFESLRMSAREEVGGGEKQRDRKASAGAGGVLRPVHAGVGRRGKSGGARGRGPRRA